MKTDPNVRECTNLGSENTVHRQNPDLVVDGKGSLDLASDKGITFDLSELFDRTLLSKDTLVSHVSSGSLRDDEDLVVGGLEESVGESSSNETVGLSVPNKTDVQTR